MAIQNFGLSGGGIQLSPGVTFTEVDLTTTTAPVDTTTGAIAGVFSWGPIGELARVTSENDLVAQFGKPSTDNAETWFTAASFLAYSSSLLVSRAANTDIVLAAIATESNTAASSFTSVNNQNEFDARYDVLQTGSVEYAAKYSGSLGNTLKISVCDSPDAFSANVNLRTAAANLVFDYANTAFSIDVGSRTGTINLYSPNTAPFGVANTPMAAAQTVSDLYEVGDLIEVGTSQIGTQLLKIIDKSITIANTAGANTGSAAVNFVFDQPYRLSAPFSTAFLTRKWEYSTLVDQAPGRTAFVEANGNTALQFANTSAQLDELHVVVVDQGGAITGAPGSVLEIFQGLSRATDARLSDGTSNFYRNVINNRSNYIRAYADRLLSPSAPAATVATSTAGKPFTERFVGGTDQTDETIDFGSIARAYDLFASSRTSDVSLVMQGKARGGVGGEQLANYLLDNIAGIRKDCVVFVSPTLSDVLNQPFAAVQNLVNFRNRIRSTSYGVMDTGYKQMYDKYNDVFRWVPLNGDIAGVCARTDGTRDPWFSPGGVDRGQIRNVIRLAFNPGEISQRNELFRNGINPVMSEPGAGTYLNGDKTLLKQASAFDAINVRRLFIVLEKTIAAAVQPLLFEFNDDFTRNQAVNIIEPFLRNVQGRRGIIDFRVQCDSSNNPPQVVDSNTLVCDVYVSPSRAIRNIKLNFVATRSGVEFTELVG